MEDERIIELYWSRDEAAISHTKQRYGEKLKRISFNILKNYEDAEESENETYLKAWGAIPPKRPQYFFAFLAKICRNISFHRLDWLNADKRNAEIVQLTAEMEQCIPDRMADRRFEAEEIGEIFSAFLQNQSKQNQVIFIRRYFFAEPIREIARHLGISEGTVKSSLSRTRNKLRVYLKKEDIRV